MIRFLQTPGPFKKIVLGGLLLLICAAMVIAFVPGGLGSDVSGQPGKGVIAKVDGGDITAEQVRQAAQRMAQQQAQEQASRYGVTPSMLLPLLMQQATKTAADQLINRQMLLAQADHLGLHATKQEIQDDLQHGVYAARLFPGGNFIGETEYEDLLSQNGLTPATFESDVVAKGLILTKLQALITGGASVSDAEIREQFEKRNTKVKFDYAILRVDDLRKGLHPTSEELKAFYTGHQGSYANSIPEKRKLRYAVVDLAKIETGIHISRDELQAYYDQHRDEYRTPEQVKVSHILIKTPLPGSEGKVDEKGVAAAQHRAEELLKQLKAGAKFEDLAKKYSEDPGSAKEGGSLGLIGRGRTVPEFEKTAFSLAKGQTSDLVKSSYGFHIIRVDDKQEAHLKTVDEVKDQIEPLLQKQKATQLAQAQGEALLTQARAQGLDAAASAKGVGVITSDFVGRQDLLPGLGPAKQFMDAVFGAKEKSPPDLAPVTQGFAVFEVLAIQPPSTPTFESIHAKVEEQFKTYQSSVLLQQKTQELADRAKAAHDLKKVAKELGATVKTSDFVGPEGQVPDVGSMTGEAASAFEMKPGEISGPIHSGANGVVLALLEKQAPSDTEFAAQRDQIRDALLQNKKQELFGLFVSSLRDQMQKSGKIKINDDEMKTLTHAPAQEGT
jgi:peptidyl-prolyl cis-trans isomerase D